MMNNRKMCQIAVIACCLLGIFINSCESSTFLTGVLQHPGKTPFSSGIYLSFFLIELIFGSLPNFVNWEFHCRLNSLRKIKVIIDQCLIVCSAAKSIESTQFVICASSQDHRLNDVYIQSNFHAHNAICLILSGIMIFGISFFLEMHFGLLFIV